jgi:hypothetical protein
MQLIYSLNGRARTSSQGVEIVLWTYLTICSSEMLKSRLWSIFLLEWWKITCVNNKFSWPSLNFQFMKPQTRSFTTYQFATSKLPCQTDFFNPNFFLNFRKPSHMRSGRLDGLWRWELASFLSKIFTLESWSQSWPRWAPNRHSESHLRSWTQMYSRLVLLLWYLLSAASTFYLFLLIWDCWIVWLFFNNIHAHDPIFDLELLILYSTV